MRQTTLVVTTGGDGDEAEDGAVTAPQASPHDDTEAGLTAASWCPPGVSPEFYSILRRQAELVASSRVKTEPDGSPFYRPEPYHKKFGLYSAYQEMVAFSNNYKVGASQGETLANYDVLRDYAKMFRPSGPHSRALTEYEVSFLCTRLFNLLVFYYGLRTVYI